MITQHITLNVTAMPAAITKSEQTVEAAELSGKLEESLARRDRRLEHKHTRVEHIWPSNIGRTRELVPATRLEEQTAAHRHSETDTVVDKSKQELQEEEKDPKQEQERKQERHDMPFEELVDVLEDNGVGIEEDSLGIVRQRPDAQLRECNAKLGSAQQSKVLAIAAVQGLQTHNVVEHLLQLAAGIQ
jgi:DNA polymerase I-like protein with 3'-5' exonuclease and polymerase domains